MSWLRLEESYAAALSSLRWEATAVWPIVLVLLKRGRGVVEERALDPVRIKMEFNGIPERHIERGIQALKDSGMLSLGEKTLRRGRGTRVARGWVAQLDIKPDPRPMNARRTRPTPVDNHSSLGLKGHPVDKSSNRAERQGNSAATGFNPRDYSVNPRDKSEGIGHPVEITGGTGSPSRAGARIPSFLLVEREKNKEENLWDVYRQSSPGSRSHPPRLWFSITRQLLSEFDNQDLAVVLRWAASSPEYDWHRRRGYTSFDAVLAPSKFAGRLERARKWELLGSATGRPVETVGEFHKMAECDQQDLVRWPEAQRQGWVRLVDEGWPGSAAMLELEGAI